MGKKDDKRPTRWGDVLRLVFFLGIGIFFIYRFLIKLEPEQKAAIWQSFVNADYAWVAVAMLTCTLSHYIRALRWRLLFQTIGHTPLRNHIFGSVIVGYLANLAFPRAGEVVRCATLRTSEGIPMEKSIGTVVTERIIDMMVFVLIVAVGMLAMFGQAKDWLYDTLSERYEHLPSMWTLGITTVVGIATLLAAYKLFWKRLLKYSLFKKIDNLVRGMGDGVKSILHLGARRTALFVAYSVVIYSLYILGGYIIFQAFGATRGLGLGAAFVVYLFGTVGMTFSQGGIGVYPVLVQVALGIYGISMETGAACGWLLWGSQQAVIVSLGAVYTVYFSVIKRRYNKKQQIWKKPDV